MHVIISKNINKEKSGEKVYRKPQLEWKSYWELQFIPFWVIPRRLSSNCRRFGTHYRCHLHRHSFIHLPMKMEPIVSSETPAIRTQTPGNYPKRNKLHLEHGESLKTRIIGNSQLWEVFRGFNYFLRENVFVVLSGRF